MHPLALTGNYQLAAAIILGIFAGIVLVKINLAFREGLYGLFLLKDGAVINTLLMALVSGVILCGILQKTGLTAIHVRSGYFWPSLAGGILSGLGAALCGMTPASAVSSLGGGRLHAFWVLLGMALALPAVGCVADFLGKNVYAARSAMAAPNPVGNVFAPDNPAFYVVVLGCAMLLLVQFTLGGGPKD